GAHCTPAPVRRHRPPAGASRFSLAVSGRRRPWTPHYAGPVPTPVRLVLAGAFLLAAAVLLTIAVPGALGRLRRNPWAGVRTRGTLASDEAFTVANRVAAVPLGAAGIVALLGGVTLVVGGPGPVVWTV